MKTMILIPSYYSYRETLCNAFISLGHDVYIIDWEKEMPSFLYKIHKKTGGVTNRLSFIQQKYVHIWANKLYIEKYDEIKPDLVLVYNNQKVFPETLLQFRVKGSKIAFILGDHPLWSKTSMYNLQILQYSDYTIIPDSGWLDDLKRIGCPNLFLDFLSNSPKTFYKTDNIPDAMHSRYDANLLFIGRTYIGSDGFRRALFLSKFSEFGLKLFGDKNWRKWMICFPELGKCYNQLSNRIDIVEYNYALNCCKVYPIDINSGFRNGIHMRVFEAISAGTFPLVEWTKDLEDVFGDSMLYIRNYSDASELAEYILNNGRERKERCICMQEIVRQFEPEKTIARLLEYLRIS